MITNNSHSSVILVIVSYSGAAVQIGSARFSGSHAHGSKFKCVTSLA